MAPDVAILGLGLIGGSLGAALRRAGWRVVGFDANPAHLERALELGLVDDGLADARSAVRQAPLAVLAVPVGSIVSLGASVADALGPDAVLTDVGSTKRSIVAELETILAGRFVGGHPIAGTERSGPEAADPALFARRLVVLTRTGSTDEDALHRVEQMWLKTGIARVEVQDPDSHDRIFAAVSHLPHLAAFVLCAALGRLGEPELESLEGLGLAGFVDTTRIAASSPRTWCDVFLANRAHLVDLGGRLRDSLDVLLAAIERRDQAGIIAELERAGALRRRVVGS